MNTEPFRFTENVITSSPSKFYVLAVDISGLADVFRFVLYCAVKCVNSVVLEVVKGESLSAVLLFLGRLEGVFLIALLVCGDVLEVNVRRAEIDVSRRNAKAELVAVVC